MMGNKESRMIKMGEGKEEEGNGRREINRETHSFSFSRTTRYKSCRLDPRQRFAREPYLVFLKIYDRELVDVLS